MKRFRLTARQRRMLRAQVSATKDVKVAKRSFALLAVDEGDDLRRLPPPPCFARRVTGAAPVIQMASDQRAA